MDVVRALDITLPTEADLQAVEYNNTPQNTGNGTGIQINARWADTVNEVIALRLNDNSVDRDNDGLLNAWETSHGLNPDKADSDGDLYSDPAELIRNSSPKLATSLPDGAVLTILGTGDGSLPGSDLSDPDNNIDDSNALRCRIRLAQRHGQRTGFF